MPSNRCLHVVVAGGGPAATEAVFVLREHAGARVRITVVAPETLGQPEALPVAASFAALDQTRQSLPEIADQLGAQLVAGRVVAVDAHRRRAHLDGGRSLGYDALVLAVGAAARHTIDDALTLFGDPTRRAVERVLAEGAPVVDFVVPPGVTRVLALYELAVGVAEEASLREQDVALRMLTPEATPLELFGAEAGVAVGRLLETYGIAFAPSSSVFEGIDGLLRVNDAATVLPEARTVALPALDGPSLPGVPATSDGFVPVDAYGAVPGLPDVYAAGDATACPIKHIDIACAQAATIADVLAARAGCAVSPEPWTPQIREHLLSDHGIGDLVPAAAGGHATDTTAILRVIADDDPALLG